MDDQQVSNGWVTISESTKRHKKKREIVMQTEKPNIKELSEREVACVSFTGNFIGKPEIFAGLFNKLCGWAGPKGLMTQATVFLASYENCPETTPLEELRLDICMSIPQDTETDGGIQKKLLPGGTYAAMHCELAGPEEYETVWKDLVEWADSNHYQMDMSRPSYEVYLNNPDEHPEKLHILDLCLSVKSRQ